VTAVAIAVPDPEGRRMGDELVRVGADAVTAVAVDAVAVAGLGDVDAVLVPADPRALSTEAVTACDRAGIRIVAVCAGPHQERYAATFGVAVVDTEADGWTLLDAVEGRGRRGATGGADRGPRVVVVWGPSGAPGRSTIAVELASELARTGRRVALVDADTHAASLALGLGLPDEGPGFAAACRQAHRGLLDAAELDRISVPVVAGAGELQLLAGINRPSRWPELDERKVTAALQACRSWVDHTVVDVAAPLERDEEIVSDLSDGPRRNAATLAALAAADHVVAVLAADPLGVARFVRAHAELRAAAGATRATVIANRLRPGALGVDARGQVRRALERFAGIHDVWFLPLDPRSADAAALAAEPIAVGSPRSPITLAMRRIVAEAIAPVPPVARTLGRKDARHASREATGRRRAKRVGRASP
jgi:MinD-like ATPase involved in chromosome partitioning or flagellar assembly